MHLKLPQFYVVLPSRVKRLQKKEELIFEVTILKTWPSGDTEVVEVSEGDVAFFEWPLMSKNKKGGSPVDLILDDFIKMSQLDDIHLNMMKYSVDKQDRSFRAERTRWQNFDKSWDKHKKLRVAIAAELCGTIADRPMTEYFDFYQVLRLRERLAIVREYLVSAFNIFIRTYAKRCGYDEDVSLELRGYPSSDQIKGCIEGLESQQVTGEEAIELTKDARQ